LGGHKFHDHELEVAEREEDGYFEDDKSIAE